VPDGMHLYGAVDDPFGGYLLAAGEEQRDNGQYIDEKL
jgi:hypothetical protein